MENFTNLKTLSITNNNIEELPISIGNLYQLEELYMADNINLEIVPNTIGNLTKT